MLSDCALAVGGRHWFLIGDVVGRYVGSHSER